MNNNKNLSLDIFFDRIYQSWKIVLETSSVLITDIERSTNRQILEARFNYDNMEKSLHQIQYAAKNPEVIIATTGTTSSGKSTIANVLIGEDLLPKAVQEMSAGVVKIIHNDKIKKLIIEKTHGAIWETGEWDNINVSQIKEKLTDSMECYRELIEEEPDKYLKIDPPKSIIYWPTLIGNWGAKFNLPSNAQISILDLPGLKYIDDKINSNVIRPETEKALCLVSYNSAETDIKKQQESLQQVIDGVKKLGGSPARMLFLLNKIDIFLKDDDPTRSVKKFYSKILNNIKKNLKINLEEFSEDIDKIDPILFSSEPANGSDSFV